MADRSISVRLALRIKEFEAGAAGVNRTLKGVDKKLAETAGFASGMRKKLEDAVKKLPKVEIDANSTPAEVKIAELRAKLEKLSGRIGVDIDPSQALLEMAAIQKELNTLGEGASFDVRANIGSALTELQTINDEVDRLNGETARPRVELEAAAAQAEVADLQRRMQDLARRYRAGVDLDTGAARAELGSIQRDLELLNATNADPKVRVDSAAALAELRAVQSELNSVDGHTARVRIDGDAGGALRAIALVGAALAGLPSVATIGLAVGGLGAGFGAAAVGAGAFAAVAIPGLTRVNEALKQTASSSGGAGGAMKSAAQKAAEAASAALRLAEAQDRVKDSADKVREAQRSVTDAVAGVARAKADAARAAEDAADREAQAASRIADAERSVQDAHRATQRAIEDLSRAREQAAQKIQDLALATEGGALSEERAQLSIQRAQQDLAKTNASKTSTSYDKQDAALRLKEAQFNLKEIQARNAQLAKEQVDATKKGVEGSDEVVAAKERILQAQSAEASAERALGQARADAAKAARDGAQQVADANQKVLDAQRKVADAQKDVAKAQRDQLRAVQALKVEQLQQAAALQKTASGGGGAATKMAQLSKAEKELAKDVKAFNDAYIEWQRSLEPDVFPVLRHGMDLLQTGWETSTPLVKTSSRAIDEFLKKANTDLKSQSWQDFFTLLADQAPRSIRSLGDSTINVADGLKGIIAAFLPFADDLLKKVENLTLDFSKWGQGLSTSSEFKTFIGYVQQNGPKVFEILQNLATFVGKVFSVGAGNAPPILDFLVSLSEKLANLEPSQIEAIAKGVGLIFAALKIGATLKIGAFVLLAETLSKMSPGQIQALAIAIAAVVTATKGYGVFKDISGFLGKGGDSAKTAAGGFGSLGSVLKTAGIAALAYGAVKGIDLLSDSLSGLNPRIDKLADGLADFGKGGRPAGELLDQMRPKVSGVSTNFETLADSMARLTSDNAITQWANGIYKTLDGLGLSLDNGAQSVGNVDQSLAQLVGSGRSQEAAQAFQRIAKQATDAGTPVDKLKELFPLYAQSMQGVAPSTGEVGKAMELLGGSANGAQTKIGEANQKLADFAASLNTFKSQTDAVSKVRDLESAFKDTKSAIHDANGVLELTPGLTGKQRDAVLLARDAFASLLEKVRTTSDAQVTLSGRTTDARDAFLKQLPELGKLAGGNKSARDEILKLADAYGISRLDAEKAMDSAKNLVKVLGTIKSKDVKIGVDTGPAKDELDAFIKRYNNLPISLAVSIAKKVQATGGIQTSSGVDLMAGGGIKGGSSTVPPPPQISSSPTSVARSSTIFAEAGKEAYIPYDLAYRDRAIAILSQVASDFGLTVYGSEAAKQIDSMTGALKETQYSVDSSLGTATSTLTQTLGSSGSFTGVLVQVGKAGTDMSASWKAGADTIGKATADGTKQVSASVLDLRGSILDLAKAVLDAKSSAGKGTADKAVPPPPKSSSSKSSSKGVMTADKNVPPPPWYSDKASANRIEGYAPANSSPVFVFDSNVSSYSAPVNTSQVSAPQTAPQQVVPVGPRGTPDVYGAGASGGQGGASVNFYGTTIQDTMDADLVSAKIGQVLDSRG